MRKHKAHSDSLNPNECWRRNRSSDEENFESKMFKYTHQKKKEEKNQHTPRKDDSEWNELSIAEYMKMNIQCFFCVLLLFDLCQF